MSSLNAQQRVPKRRAYRLGKRAEQLEETRRRIVEAAVDLHCSIGPARTTVSQIADRAGVQRHTFYAHFPDERSLFDACSSFALERDPLPDVEAWLETPPGRERVARGLSNIYGWFDRNAGQAACVLRDAEIHEVTRETVESKMKPTFDRGGVILAEGLSGRQVGLLQVAMQFATWRTLGESRSPSAAAELMADAIEAIPDDQS